MFVSLEKKQAWWSRCRVAYTY